MTDTLDAIVPALGAELTALGTALLRALRFFAAPVPCAQARRMAAAMIDLDSGAAALAAVGGSERVALRAGTVPAAATALSRAHLAATAAKIGADFAAAASATGVRAGFAASATMVGCGSRMAPTFTATVAIAGLRARRHRNRQSGDARG